MATEETMITDRGMVTIPDVLRRRLDIKAGDKLRWAVDDEGELTVEVVKQRHGAFDDFEAVPMSGDGQETHDVAGHEQDPTMSGDGRPAGDSDDRAGLLPEQSLLSLEEYLDMQRAIGNETRFRIVNYLVEEGAHSATELRDALELPSNTLHYHLETLVDVGLVENRKRTDSTSEGLYSYYRATSLGEGILEHGVRALLREEWELLDAYAN